MDRRDADSAVATLSSAGERGSKNGDEDCARWRAEEDDRTRSGDELAEIEGEADRGGGDKTAAGEAMRC